MAKPALTQNPFTEIKTNPYREVCVIRPKSGHLATDLCHGPSFSALSPNPFTEIKTPTGKFVLYVRNPARKWLIVWFLSLGEGWLGVPWPLWLKYWCAGRMGPWGIPRGICPEPTCISTFSGGGELGVSGTFPHMSNWLAERRFDVQVARLELCCPCCRIFETSTSKNCCWASPILLFRSL